jgi:hypothetical protein
VVSAATSPTGTPTLVQPDDGGMVASSVTGTIDSRGGFRALVGDRARSSVTNGVKNTAKARTATKPKPKAKAVTKTKAAQRTKAEATVHQPRKRSTKRSAGTRKHRHRHGHHHVHHCRRAG